MKKRELTWGIFDAVASGHVLPLSVETLSAMPEFCAE